MNLLRPRAVTCTDVDIGIKMRRDYKGDLRKVLDRPSRLSASLAPARFFASYFRPVFLRRIPCTAFQKHRRSRARARARGTRCIFRHEVEKDHPRAFISERLWKKASGRWIRSPWDKRSHRRVSGIFRCLRKNAHRCASVNSVISMFSEKLKGLLDFRDVYGKYETSLILKPLRQFIVWFIIPI